ncbi:hypothetical protein HY449_01220 [Candidatus Pacearchaeota archaeon]|nr:hypothetical protein [Candidatus Pacearchaeota archaeon]
MPESVIKISWETVERPGYFGKKRDELEDFWNFNYPQGWRIAWQWGEQVLTRPLALQIYEDAYFEFLKNNPEILNWITSTASDVYDTSPSNVKSGLNYDEQETPNNHFHDIAIRRAVLRNGRKFLGDRLVEVRKPGTEGARLSPYSIPFHLPNLIYQGEDIKDYNYLKVSNHRIWWKTLGRERGIEHTVEEFYQHNKLLQKMAFG